MSIRKSLVIAFVENYALAILGLVGSIVIARLLSPAQIGTFSVGATLIGLAHIFRDFGVGTYIIQEQELTEDRLRAGFTVTLALGWSVACILIAISELAASFYREPQLEQVILVLAANFFLLPFGSVTMAYMRRQMRFMPILFIKVSSTIAQLVTSVLLAWFGHGPLSLAWGSLAGALLTVALSLILRPRELPRWPGVRDVRRVLKFGSFASGAIVATEVGNAAPDLVLGKLQSMESVAYLGRASGLVDVFNRFIGAAVHSVTLPYFSNEKRRGGNPNAAFLKGTEIMTGLSWPFFVAVTIVADDIIVLLFGTQWVASAGAARLLCLAAIVQNAIGMSGSLLVSYGVIERYARLQIVGAVIKATLVVASAPFGVEAVAGSLIVSAVVQAALGVRELARVAHLRGREILPSLLPSVMMTAVCAVPIALFVTLHPSDHSGSLTFLMSVALVATSSWIIGAIVTRHAIREEALRALAALRIRIR